MLLETFLPILVIFFLQENGLTQTILYIIIVLGFFLLTAWKRPYNSKLQMRILLFNQGSKVVMGVIAAIFAINNKTQTIPEERINSIGFMLILLIFIVMGINLAISLWIIIISFYQRIKEWRSRRQREHSNLQVRNTEVNPTTHNFIDEQQSPSNFIKSISDLPMDSNLPIHDRAKNGNETSNFAKSISELPKDSNLQFRNGDKNGNEEQLQPAPQSKQSLIFKEADTENESKRNIRIRPVENNFMLDLIWLNRPSTQIDSFKQNKTKKKRKK